MNLYLKKFITSKFKKPGKALDLGAGDFIDVKGLKKLGWYCEGVDFKTGINLEKIFESKNKPLDLVFSNYVLHKLKNKEIFIKTANKNLRNKGWFFIHTFDKSDPNNSSDITEEFINKLLTNHGFKNITARIFNYYDNEKGHKHWHKILEVSAQKDRED